VERVFYSDAFQLTERYWEYQNRVNKFAIFLINFAYIYVTGVLLQAWDCIESNGNLVMRSDTKQHCDSASFQDFRRYAMMLIIVIGAGVPLGNAVFVSYLCRERFYYQCL